MVALPIKRQLFNNFKRFEDYCLLVLERKCSLFIFFHFFVIISSVPIPSSDRRMLAFLQARTLRRGPVPHPATELGHSHLRDQPLQC